jgi:hypothetical protein
MPYLQKATNNYFGFMPESKDARVHPYVVSSSEALAISIGDVVTFTTNLATVRVITGAYTGAVLGVAASPLAANAGSTSARPGGDASTLVKIYDDPDQVFITCDTTSGLIGSTGIGKAYAILATGPVGDTGPINFNSRMALSGITSTQAGAFKVLGLHPVEDGYSTDAGSAGVAASVRKYRGVFALHYWGVGSTTLITT